jgi:hypothetical protein
MLSTTSDLFGYDYLKSRKRRPGRKSGGEWGGCPGPRRAGGGPT